MAQRRRPKNDRPFWDELTLMMPRRAVHGAIEVAHTFNMDATEYCRRAILLRLAADGINLDQYEEPA